MNECMAATLDGFAVPQHTTTPGIAAQPVPSTYPAELVDLLLPENRALPLVGRAAELHRLVAWLDQDEPHLQVVFGPPGSGKTRLAVEFCAQAETRGWATGFAAHAPEAPRLNQANPTVLVVDSTTPHIIRAAVRSAGPLFRVLLLASSPDFPATGHLPDPIALPSLALDHRTELFANAAMAAGSHRQRPLARVNKNDLNGADPLHLTMAGLLAPTIGPHASLSLTLPALAARLAELEAQRIDRSAEQAGIDPFVLRHLATCITLRRGCTLTAAACVAIEEAQALGLHLPQAPTAIVDTLADVLLDPVSQILRSIAPRLVADAFIANELQHHSPEVRAAISARNCPGIRGVKP